MNPLAKWAWWPFVGIITILITYGVYLIEVRNPFVQIINRSQLFVVFWVSWVAIFSHILAGIVVVICYLSLRKKYIKPKLYIIHILASSMILVILGLSEWLSFSFFYFPMEERGPVWINVKTSGLTILMLYLIPLFSHLLLIPIWQKRNFKKSSSKLASHLIDP